jgi:hypothetical protein
MLHWALEIIKLGARQLSCVGNVYYDLHQCVGITFGFSRKVQRVGDSGDILRVETKYSGPLTYELNSGFSGLGVSMLPSGTQDRGSLPTEAVGFFRMEKSTACLPSQLWGM